MPKPVKWILIVLAILVVIVITAVVVAPMVINLEKYKPRIEAEAGKALGRPVTLGGKIEPSVFPWVGVALSDVRISNPAGFAEKDFVSVGLFEVRVKLLPLLSGDYQIRRFVVVEPRIVMEKRKDGHTNLEGLGGPPSPSPTPKPDKAPADKPKSEQAPAIKALVVDEFAITNGHLLYIDAAAGARHEVKDLNLTLTDVSLDKPIRMDFSAVADKYPLVLTGTVGPVGTAPGKSPLNVNLVAELIKELKVQVQGTIDPSKATPQFNMHVQVAPFSPRKVLTELKQMPFEPADPKALNSLALSLALSGSPESVAITGGKLTLDDSLMTFQAQAKAFDKPDIKLKADLDRIDIDRYLPPPAEKKAVETPPATPAAAPQKKTDYTALRKLVLDAQIKIAELKANNLRMQNVVMKATASNGVIRLSPLNIDLYKGSVAVDSTLNVQQSTPRSTANLAVKNLQAGPLIRDMLNKDIIEGVMNSSINLQFSGDAAETIRQTLSGKGELKFSDGAIVGIDLANMVRNVQSSFGVGEVPAEKPRTDFSELLVPFTVTDGVAKLNDAQVSSPLLRATANGNADLVKETLDMRVVPTFVGTLKGQGDTKQRTGVMVPVLVGGTFDKPKFRPDIKGLLNQPLPDKEALKQMAPSKQQIKDTQKDLEKQGKDLLKGLPFGQPQQQQPQPTP
ncbi:MAG: AsmA family protein [Desulfobacterales bacterium]|nr:AsmA family protein [Desulfobacterales bacterium]